MLIKLTHFLLKQLSVTSFLWGEGGGAGFGSSLTLLIRGGGSHEPPSGWFGCHFIRNVPINSISWLLLLTSLLFSGKVISYVFWFLDFSAKEINVKFFFAFKNDDFLHKRSKIIFLAKRLFFCFKSVIWEIVWYILHVCGTKIEDFENSSHNSHTQDPRQPWGCSWGDYATQGADQGLKLKLGTLSNWGIWVLEVLTSHSSDTRGGTTRYPPPADHHLKMAQP